MNNTFILNKPKQNPSKPNQNKFGWACELFGAVVLCCVSKYKNPTNPGKSAYFILKSFFVRSEIYLTLLYRDLVGLVGFIIKKALHPP